MDSIKDRILGCRIRERYEKLSEAQLRSKRRMLWVPTLYIVSTMTVIFLGLDYLAGMGEDGWLFYFLGLGSIYPSLEQDMRKRRHIINGLLGPQKR